MEAIFLESQREICRNTTWYSCCRWLNTFLCKIVRMHGWLQPVNVPLQLCHILIDMSIWNDFKLATSNVCHNLKVTCALSLLKAIEAECQKLLRLISIGIIILISSYFFLSVTGVMSLIYPKSDDDFAEFLMWMSHIRPTSSEVM